MPWYIVADGGGMRRDPSNNVRLASLGPFGPTVLSTADFEYDFMPTGRFLVGRTLGECFQIEGVYVGVTEADDSVAVRNTTANALGGEGNLFSPFGGFGANPIVGLDYNDFAQARYSASLQNVELNIRRKLPMPPGRLATSILFGVRYVGTPEEFEYLTESAMPAPGGSSAVLRVDTDNQMIGPQFGALFEVYLENRWWLNFEAKAALLSNRAEQITSLRQIDAQGGVQDFVDSRREEHTAFLGDLAVTFVYRWSPHFATRLGYQAIWINDVALAPQNMNTNINLVTEGPASLEHHGHTVYHGPHAGIMLSW